MKASWLLASLVLCVGCSGPDASNPLVYEQAKSLYAICSREDTSRLEQAARRIVAADEAAELSEAEAKMLLEIVQQGRDGDWKEAGAVCRDLLERQVRF